MQSKAVDRVDHGGLGSVGLRKVGRTRVVDQWPEWSCVDIWGLEMPDVIAETSASWTLLEGELE